MVRIFSLVLISLSVTSRTALAAPVGVEYFSSPVIESFEGIVGSLFPSGLWAGGMYSNVPDGAILPSGVRVRYGNAVTDLFPIGDFVANEGGGQYIVGTDYSNNGVVRSPADIVSGTAFAGAGGWYNEFIFELPFETHRIGLFVVGEVGEAITLSAFNSAGVLIEAVSAISPGPIPIDDADFLGLESSAAIASFSIASNRGFVFDDMMFEAPEPSTFSLLCAGVLLRACLTSRRRTIADDYPEQR